MIDYSRTRFGYQGGTFSEEELEIAKQKQTPLTLDMAIPCSCLNKCYYCGYKNTQQGNKLSQKEIFSIVDQFKEIGGKSIKILGEGEPMLRLDILELIGYIHGKKLWPVLFTCGDILGDDQLAKKIHGIDGLKIIQRLKESNTTIMLKYEKENEDTIVGNPGFSEKRNNALKRLLKAGFNQSSPTHLGFGIVVLKENYEEIPWVYERAVKQNIYPLLCPLMPIGKSKDNRWRRKIGITSKQIIQLSQQLYTTAKRHGIEVKCAADFPGGLPCDIARTGFYIADTGNIYLCEDEEYVGNIRELPLKEAWKKIFEWKNKKYGAERWSGKCHYKRQLKIIPKDYDPKVNATIFQPLPLES